MVYILNSFSLGFYSFFYDNVIPIKCMCIKKMVTFHSCCHFNSSQTFFSSFNQLTRYVLIRLSLCSNFTEFVQCLILPRPLPTDALTKFHERPNFFLKSSGSLLSRALKRAVAKIKYIINNVVERWKIYRTEIHTS